VKKIKTKFKNLFVIQGKKFEDKRGFLREVFIEKITKKKLIFSIVSKSKKNVVRGLHIQLKNSQTKQISVLKGKILDVVVDLRKNSKTFKKFFKIILSDKNCKSLFIPSGFAHGFLGLDEENIVLYSCDNYRNKSSERSIKWNDPELKINWNIKKIISSKKDKSSKSLREFLLKF
jgi:dTDP-4-dehydrorhamnose 3,5-epimerase